VNLGRTKIYGWKLGGASPLEKTKCVILKFMFGSRRSSIVDLKDCHKKAAYSGMD